MILSAVPSVHTAKECGKCSPFMVRVFTIVQLYMAHSQIKNKIKVRRMNRKEQPSASKNERIHFQKTNATPTENISNETVEKGSFNESDRCRMRDEAKVFFCNLCTMQ